MSWQEVASTADKTIRAARDAVRRYRRPGSPLVLAAILLFVGYHVSDWFPGNLEELLQSYYLITILAGLCYLTGFVFLAIAARRIWRYAQPLKPTPVQDRPRVIKGPLAFTADDGEVFRKLQREDELGELVGHVMDDQIPLIVVMGESGAGKTSLLRAGLTHILRDKDVSYHYWEVLPKNPEEGLLRAIDGVDNLGDLINPTEEVCPRPRVIVLDQFEQLRGRSASRNPILRLLRRVAREAKPPHRVTWIGAFRREYLSDWHDEFLIAELKRGFSPRPPISVRLMPLDLAREIIATLCAEARLTVEQKVVDNLLTATQIDGVVSPVDIGIGLMVLSELAKDGVVTHSDYHFAGGADGVLAQYIERKLAAFTEPDREKLLLAMLALRDPRTDQRLAEGLTVDEVAIAIQADPDRLRPQLKRLAQSDARLLEAVGDDRYRLPHERLISALNRVTGEILPEIQQARLKLESAYLAWQNNDQRKQYLLGGTNLRNVDRYESQIHWGEDVENKKQFVRRSRQRRMIRHAACIAATLALIVTVGFVKRAFDQAQARQWLADNNYPTQLYDYQHQLESLSLNDPLNLERFPWINTNKIRALELDASGKSISGLARLVNCESLESLTLDLSSSQVGDLQSLKDLNALNRLTLDLVASQVRDLQALKDLNALTHLTLVLNYSDVSDLQAIEGLSTLTNLILDLRGTLLNDLQALNELKSLTHLTIYLSSAVNDLHALKGLNALTHLTLGFGSSQMSDLSAIKDLTALTHLTLDLSYSQVRDLQALKNLTALTHLTLDLSYSQVRDLQALKDLTALTHLTIHLSGSRVSDLQALKALNALTHLTLNLSDSRVSDLQALKGLNALTNLSISFGVYSVVSGMDVLKDLNALTHLTLDLTHTQVHDVQALRGLNALTTLTLDLSGTSLLRDIQALGDLTVLTHLTLNLRGSTRVRDLQTLKNLNALTHLTLDLRSSELSDLDALKDLNDLTHLTLDLELSNVSNLQVVNDLTTLTHLTLNLSNSQVRDLQALTSLTALTYLKLNVGNSRVSDLRAIGDLSGLRSLILRADSDQRVTLRKIPAHTTRLEF